MALAESVSSTRKVVPDPAAILDLLRGFLARVLQPEAAAWLDAEIERHRADIDDRRLAIALGLAGRRIGRADLGLSQVDIAAAQALRSGWRPERWSTGEAARTAILLATYRGDDQVFAARVDRLCTNAEITEFVAYLKGFAVFPAAQELYERAREGVRASMDPLFEAIACHNPYPFDHFDEAAWNQMVVKCVFVGTPIETVVGLQERRNPEVVRMLGDLVSERRSAGRPLPAKVFDYIASGQ